MFVCSWCVYDNTGQMLVERFLFLLFHYSLSLQSLYKVYTLPYDCRECNSVILCSWCEYDSSGQILGEPFCDTSATCPGGHMGGGDTTDSGETTTKSDQGGGMHACRNNYMYSNRTSIIQTMSETYN